MRKKLHKSYQLKDGTSCPGVTTVLNVLGKPGLLYWVKKVTQEGYDFTAIVGRSAGIGILVHRMILDHFNQTFTDLSEYSPDEVKDAEQCFSNFIKWSEGKKIEGILYERPLVSEFYKYGGTLDFYGGIEGVLTLVDFKTTNQIRAEALYQLSAYKRLLEENGYGVEEVKILRLKQGGPDEIEELTRTDLTKEFKVFLACRELYQALREAK